MASPARRALAPLDANRPSPSPMHLKSPRKNISALLPRPGLASPAKKRALDVEERAVKRSRVEGPSRGVAVCLSLSAFCLWGFLDCGWVVRCGMWNVDVVLSCADGVKEGVARSASPDASVDGVDTRLNDTRRLSIERERESRRQTQTRKVLPLSPSPHPHPHSPSVPHLSPAPPSPLTTYYQSPSSPGKD